MSESAADDNRASEDSLLKQIQAILDSTDLSKWSQGGCALKDAAAVKAQREIWEYIYSVPLADGTIALRCSQNVDSQYIQGGFRLEANGPARYTVELRPLGWDLKILTDPKLGAVRHDPTVEVLLTGKLAKELFDIIELRYAEYLVEKQKRFTAEAADMVNKLPKLIEKNSQLFKPIDMEEGQLCFRGKVGKFHVDLIKVGEKEKAIYGAVVLAEGERLEVKDATVSEALFEAAQHSFQLSKLSALHCALKKIA